MSATPPPSLEQVCERALRLPCSPALLPRLITTLQASESTSDDIAAIIQIDTGLAAATLRMANSAYFASGLPVENISEAVMRLGQHELYRLAALSLVSRWEAGAGHGEAGDFCRHALCTALAAVGLAEKTNGVNPQTAYTAGLVCDVGKLAIAHACDDYYPAIRAHSGANGGPWTDSETAVLGYHHVQVGARLLRAWNFPAVFIAVAEHYISPSHAPAEALPLIAHLKAAKYIATSFGPGVGEEGFLFELNESFLLEWGFTAEMLHEAMPVVHQRALARLKDKLSTGKVTL